MKQELKVDVIMEGVVLDDGTLRFPQFQDTEDLEFEYDEEHLENGIRIRRNK